MTDYRTTQEAMQGARYTGSPLTTCAGGIQGAPRHILNPPPRQRPLNGRLLASGVAWDNTESQRRWR
jgi:hypothetical protein